MATGLVDDLSNEKISKNFLFRNLKITLVKPDNMLHLRISNIVIKLNVYLANEYYRQICTRHICYLQKNAQKICSYAPIRPNNRMNITIRPNNRMNITIRPNNRMNITIKN